MGTTVEELKKLYTKLGGKDKQVATFNQPGEILNAINELDVGGGGLPDVGPSDAGKVATVNDEGEWDAETPVVPEPELPAVTTEDNGKILGVTEGAWGKVDLTKVKFFYASCQTFDISKSVIGITLQDGVSPIDIYNYTKDYGIENVAIIVKDVYNKQYLFYPDYFSPPSAEYSVQFFRIIPYDDSAKKLLYYRIFIVQNNIISGGMVKIEGSNNNVIYGIDNQGNLLNSKTTKNIYDDLVAGKVVQIKQNNTGRVFNVTYWDSTNLCFNNLYMSGSNVAYYDELSTSNPSPITTAFAITRKNIELVNRS